MYSYYVGQIKALLSFSSVVISFCFQRDGARTGLATDWLQKTYSVQSLCIWEFPAMRLALSSTNPACFITLCSDLPLRHLLITGDSIWGKEVFLWQRLGGRKVFRYISETDFLAKVKWNWFLLRQIWVRETHFQKSFQSKSCSLSLPWSCLSLLKGIAGWGLWGYL